MVDRVIERTDADVPRDNVVIHEDRTDRGSNVGWIVAVVIIVVLLLLFFGGGIFNGGGGGNTPTDVNIQAPNPTAPAGQ